MRFTVDVKLESLAKSLLEGSEDDIMDTLRSLQMADLKDENKSWYKDLLANALTKKREVI